MNRLHAGVFATFPFVLLSFLCFISPNSSANLSRARWPREWFPEISALGENSSASIAGQTLAPLNFLAPFRSYPTGLSPQSVCLADLNEDSHPDIVVACVYSRAISIHVGRGDGSFEPRKDLATRGRPYSVLAADVNHDGHADLIAAEPEDSLVSAFLGRGDGTFGPEAVFSVGAHDLFVTVGDLNGDGQLDLVTANDTSGTASVLFGHGDGTFGSRTDLPTRGQPSCVVVGDLDADGHIDLIVSDVGSGGVSVWLGVGDGVFRPVSDPRAHIRGRFIATSDFNRDGKLDVVAVLDTISIYTGNGDGTFGPKVNLAPEQPFHYTSIVVGDVNHDGILDLVATNPEDPQVLGDLELPFPTMLLYLGNEDGTFWPPRDLFVEAEAFFVAIGDLNGDGHPDLVTANTLPSSISVLPGNGVGTFGADKTYSTGSNPWYVESGDFNRDGHLDLVTVSPYANTASVFLGDGTGNLGPKMDYAVNDPSFVTVADLNSDGWPDLVMATASDYFNPTISVLLGRGEGTFAPKKEFAASGATWISVGDLNGDGKPDLATANFGTISVLLGGGDGSFSPGTPVATGTSSFPVAVADLNVDGMNDLAFVSNEDGTVSALLGHGDGTFGPRFDIPVSGKPFSVRVGDLNGDGKPDLVAGGTNRVTVLLGNGDGTFRPAPDLRAGWFPSDAVIGDVDSDGRPDIVAINLASNTLSIFQGHGDGTFDPPATFGARGGPLSAVLGDLDEDGQADIAVACARTGISVLLNRTGPGSPLPARAFLRGGHRTIPLADAPSQICIQYEPVNRDYRNIDVDLSSLRLVSTGTGAVSEIQAAAPRRSVESDTDRDGGGELTACFARSDLRRLFSSVRGRRTLDVALEGRLQRGRRFRAPLSLTILGTGKPDKAVASVAPNPLNPRGTLRFSMGTPGSVTVRIYDLGGRSVRTVIAAEQFPAGVYQVSIDGRGEHGTALASGVYFYRIETPDGITSGRFVVAK